MRSSKMDIREKCERIQKDIDTIIQRLIAKHPNWTQKDDFLRNWTRSCRNVELQISGPYDEISSSIIWVLSRIKWYYTVWFDWDDNIITISGSKKTFQWGDDELKIQLEKDLDGIIG